MAQNNASRVQVTLTSPEAIKAWGQVPRGLKAKALEQAILLLQKNKTFAPMFFSEVSGEAEVNNQKPQAKKPIPTSTKESVEKNPSKKGKVREEW